MVHQHAAQLIQCESGFDYWKGKDPNLVTFLIHQSIIWLQMLSMFYRLKKFFPTWVLLCAITGSWEESLKVTLTRENLLEIVGRKWIFKLYCLTNIATAQPQAAFSTSIIIYIKSQFQWTYVQRVTSHCQLFFWTPGDSYMGEILTDSDGKWCCTCMSFTLLLTKQSDVGMEMHCFAGCEEQSAL